MKISEKTKLKIALITFIILIFLPISSGSKGLLFFGILALVEILNGDFP